MSWEQWVEGFKTFWSQPIPIIGFTVGTVLISLLFFLAKTSFGKKAIRKANDKVEELKSDYIKLKEDTEKLNKNLKDYYEEKMALMNEAKEKEQKIIIAIGESINNKNIKSIINEYKNELKEEKIVISDVVEEKVNETKEQYEQVLNSYESIVDNYKNEFEALKQEYEKQLTELKNKANNVEEIINEGK